MDMAQVKSAKSICWQVNIEVRIRTFGDIEKISEYKKGKKLLIY